jgi:hypothetical protein
VSPLSSRRKRRADEVAEGTNLLAAVKATPSRRIADACSGRLVGLLRCTRGVPASDISVIYDPAEESIAASPENSGRASRPDDETLGCGGLITILARGGSAFSFVFVTDGGASHPRSVSWSRSRLASPAAPARRAFDGEGATLPDQGEDDRREGGASSGKRLS